MVAETAAGWWGLGWDVSQKNDLPMQLNRGRFLENGGCGYVLKSPALLAAGGAGPPPPPPTPLRLTVQVLSCQCVPGGGTENDIVDPYVVVEVLTPRDSGRVTRGIDTGEEGKV